MELRLFCPNPLRQRDVPLMSLPAKLSLQVLHILLALGVVRRLGLDEVVQATQVVSLKAGK